MLKLSKRLQAVADFITCGNYVADIGTDHGFLPIYLIQQGRCPGILAMDVRGGPLMRAKGHIIQAGLEDLIQTRLSDGLGQLLPGEAQSVVIAGLGGLTIKKILEAALHTPVLEGLAELVLEPQSEVASLRRFLRENRMYIDKETLVCEDGKFYPILHVLPQRLQPQQPYQDSLSEKQSIFDQYGEYLIDKKDPTLLQLLARDEKRRQRILHSLKGAGQEGKKGQRYQEVQKELEMIGQLLDWMQSP